MAAMPHYRRIIEKANRELIPLEVSLELTHRCNFRCRHCYIPDFQSPDVLRTDRIFELLEELAEMGTLFLALTGGEVMLREDWALIARRARQLSFHLTILTNGSLLDDEAADVLAEIGAAVDISLHANDREVFERVTGRVGSFASTLAAIRRLAERRVDLRLKIPVTRLNLDSYGSAIDLAEQLGVTWSCSPKIVARADGDSAPTMHRIAGAKLVSYLSGPHSGCHVRGQEGNPAVRGGPLCAAGLRFVSISSSGAVTACNVLPGEAGNVCFESFRTIWQNSVWLNRLRGIRRSDLHECDTCSRFEYCQRCPAQALLEDGDILGPSRDACGYAEAVELASSRGA